MNPLAFCSISALDRPLAAAAELAARHELGLELTARAPHLTDDADDAAVRGAAGAVREAGAPIVAFGSYLGQAPWCEPDQARRSAEVAARLGAPRLRVWAEAGDGAEELRRVVTWMRAACDAAAPAGIDVVVERHVGSLADTPERVERLLGAVERDNLALNYQPLDFLPADAVSKQPEDARRLAPLARYLHVKNYRADPDGGRLLPGGSLRAGVLDLEAILAAALATGYAGPIAVEFLSDEPKPLEEKLANDIDWLRGALARLECP